MSEDKRGSMLEIGGILQGLQLGSDFMNSVLLRLVKEVKDKKLYLQLNETWESWCPKVLGISHKTAQARLEEAEELGHQLRDRLFDLGAKGKTVSSLVALPEECRPAIDGSVLVIPAINEGEEPLSFPLETENAELIKKHLNDRVKKYRDTQRAYKTELKDKDATEKFLNKQITSLVRENNGLMGQLGQRNAPVNEQVEKFKEVTLLVSQAVAAARVSDFKAIAEFKDPELSGEVSKEIQMLKTSILDVETDWLDALAEVEA